MVGLVHDQHRRETFLKSRNNKAAQVQQQLALVFARRGKAKIAHNILQEFRRRQTRVEYISIVDVATAEQLKQAPDQQGLACAHFSGHHHKTFASADGIVERRQGFVVALGREQKRRVRSDLEGVSLQIVELF